MPDSSTPFIPRTRLSRLKAKVERIIEDTVPGAVIKRFIEIDLFAHGATLSFFTLISLAPLLVLVLWFTASLYPEAQQVLIEQIGEFAGAEAQAVALTVLNNANEQPDVGSLAGLWSTGLLFFGATVVFARLQTTLNIIFKAAPEELQTGVLASIRKRVFSFGVVFAIGFIVLASTLLSAVIELIVSELDLAALLPLALQLVSLVVYTAAFALLYRFLPDRHVYWSKAFLGGLITSVLFLIGQWGIGVYMTDTAPGSVYGSMGTLVALLIWMYYAAMIFYAGALITAVIDEHAHEMRKGRNSADAMRQAGSGYRAAE